ncbi:MAG TPA: peptidylglycine alpha-amidating monooxygenase [Polyangium sp.]|nr:peptidylglycine alpha-amidating monooxygenase [Polyangium sp.]
MRKVFLAGLWLVPMVVWACGNNATAPGFLGYGGSGGAGGEGGTGFGGTSALPCDVELIMRSKCQTCHAAKPIYGAPMPLVDANDFAAPARSDPSKTVAQVSSDRIHDKARPMPPLPATLDAGELATLDSWFGVGAPGGKTPCSTMGSGSSGTGGGGLSCTPDVKLRASAPYKMPKLAADKYICFGATAAITGKRHITAVAPAIDNEVIVHHMLLYEVDTPYSSAPQACGPNSSLDARLVSAWAPGAQPFVLPPEAGMPIDSTKHYMIQMHYSNLMQLSGQTDLSGFDLCTTETLRPNEADVLVFGTLNISVPPHGTSDRTCDLQYPVDIPTINLFAAGPHMHTYGSHISARVKHANGSTYEMATRDPWSFDNQYWNPISTTVAPGDTVSVRCAWNNPTTETITFGGKTSDEMCFVFTAYWPRITTPGWSWQATALFSDCTDTPP